MDEKQEKKSIKIPRTGLSPYSAPDAFCLGCKGKMQAIDLIDDPRTGLPTVRYQCSKCGYQFNAAAQHLLGDYSAPSVVKPALAEVFQNPMLVGQKAAGRVPESSTPDKR